MAKAKQTDNALPPADPTDPGGEPGPNPATELLNVTVVVLPDGTTDWCECNTPADHAAFAQAAADKFWERNGERRGEFEACTSAAVSIRMLRADFERMAVNG